MQKYFFYVCISNACKQTFFQYSIKQLKNNFSKPLILWAYVQLQGLTVVSRISFPARPANPETSEAFHPFILVFQLWAGNEQILYKFWFDVRLKKYILITYEAYITKRLL